MLSSSQVVLLIWILSAENSHVMIIQTKNDLNIFFTNYHVNIQTLFVSPSPDDCILEHVLMVSPKRQYRGILDPTTPATIFPETNYKINCAIEATKCISPVWIPARILIVLGAMSGRTTLPHAAFKSNAILQISAACL